MSSNYKSIPNDAPGAKAQLFSSKLLENLSRTHISVPVTLYFIISLGLLYTAFLYTEMNAVSIVGLFVFGILLFTLIEYSMHRFVFHMKPTTKTREKIAYNFHGVHHDYPKDTKRLAMPVPVALLIAIALFGLFWMIMNYFTYAFLAGVLVGYASYLLVHYIVHVYNPPKNIFKWLWIYHAVHHYKDSSIYFGVSSPLWDFVFGTRDKK